MWLIFSKQASYRMTHEPHDYRNDMLDSNDLDSD